MLARCLIEQLSATKVLKVDLGTVYKAATEHDVLTEVTRKTSHILIDF
jgi:hypothetical protein